MVNVLLQRALEAVSREVQDLGMNTEDLLERATAGGRGRLYAPPQQYEYRPMHSLKCSEA